MAKKATLLNRALKLKLDVTKNSTVPQIQAALDAHAAKSAVKQENSPAVAPKAVKPTVAPVETETAPEALKTPQINLKDILMMYNSVVPSRRRWIWNRNHLRNTWKEFFQVLEIASGRSGQKAEIMDKNWHAIVNKGGEPGLGNRERDDVTVVLDEGTAVTDTSAKDHRILELEAEIVRLNEALTVEANSQRPETSGETPTQPSKLLGDEDALPGEKTTLDEVTDESTTTPQEGKEVETETPANL